MSIISVEGVTKHYALGTQTVEALRGVSFDIKKGEFIAIFDSDFLPKPDWLLKTIPHFIDSKIGLVQTRWGHLNR